jgi:GxxExxY protein
MTENEISYKVRGAIFEIYNTIGPGLLESAYESALFFELKQMGLKVERQIEVPFEYKDTYLGIGYRLDLIVEDKVIIEVKSINEFSALHYKQIMSYLNLTNRKLGLLVNFNVLNITEGIARVVNNL